MFGDAACKLALLVLGYAYPAYLCYGDVKQRAIRRMRLWCMYWILMGLFTAVSPLLDAFFFWFPFYYEAKVAFAVFLWYPGLRGAEYVFHEHVDSFMAEHGPAVDANVVQAQTLTGSLLRKQGGVAKEWVQSAALKGFTALQAAAAAGAAAAATAVSPRTVSQEEREDPFAQTRAEGEDSASVTLSSQSEPALVHPRTRSGRMSGAPSAPAGARSGPAELARRSSREEEEKKAREEFRKGDAASARRGEAAPAPERIAAAPPRAQSREEEAAWRGSEAAADRRRPWTEIYKDDFEEFCRGR